METKLSIFPFRRLYGGIRHEAPEPSAATLFRDQKTVHPEGPQARDKRHMLVGPIADESFLIEIVCRRNHCRPVTSFFESLREVVIKLNNQAVGFYVGYGPFPGCMGPLPIRRCDGFLKGKEVDDNRLCPFHQISGHRVGRAHHLFKVREERIPRARKGHKG